MLEERIQTQEERVDRLRAECKDLQRQFTAWEKLAALLEDSGLVDESTVISRVSAFAVEQSTETGHAWWERNSDLCDAMDALDTLNSAMAEREYADNAALEREFWLDRYASVMGVLMLNKYREMEWTIK